MGAGALRYWAGGLVGYWSLRYWLGIGVGERLADIITAFAGARAPRVCVSFCGFSVDPDCSAKYINCTFCTPSTCFLIGGCD